MIEDDTDNLEGEDEEQEASAEPLPWSRVWQLPVIIISFGLLGLGILALIRSRPTIDYQAALDNIDKMVASEEFDGAFRALDMIEANSAKMKGDAVAHYHASRAELYYYAQIINGGQQVFNLTEAVADYQKAEDLGRDLTLDQIEHLADALLRLGRTGEVPPLIDRLPITETATRQKLIKAMVDHNLNLSEADYDETVRWLLRLSTEPNLDPKDRVWTVARLTELRIRKGFTDEAIDKLLIDMQKLRAEQITDFPELYVLLGRAYIETGQYEMGEEQLHTALAQLTADNPLRGEALYRYGGILKQRREWENAFNLFNEVVTSYAGTPSYLPAVLARAEVQAQLGNRLESMNDFALVVRLMAKAAPGDDVLRDINRKTVTQSIIIWHDRFHEEGRLIEALRLARIAEGQFDGIENLPEDLVIRLARTNWDLGAETLRESWTAAGVVVNDEGLPVVASEMFKIDPATRQQARTLFLNAGTYYSQLAAMVLELDPDRSAEAIQWAAKSYDRAGDYLAAAEALREFIRLSADQPRELWGIYTLGRSYQALQDYDGSIEQFKLLIESHPNSIEAYRSYLPLAQCYLIHPESPNPAEAERLLLFVVDGSSALEPEAIEYADALIELGMLYARAAEYTMPRPAVTYYPGAIARLTEAIDRYPNDPRINDLHYWLGHAYRLSANAIEGDLTMERPESERLELRAQRLAYLKQSASNYTAAIDGFDAVPAHKQTSDIRQKLKFARFWRADCAYDEGSYREAIALYTMVADDYPDDAAALVAIVQIVNAYSELGDLSAARTAQARAWRILRDLPDDAFQDGPLPIDRGAWERLLKTGAVIDTNKTATAGP